MKAISTIINVSIRAIIRNQVGNKTVHDRDKLKEFMSSRPALQKILPELLHREELQNKPQKSNRMKLLEKTVKLFESKFNTGDN